MQEEVQLKLAKRTDEGFLGKALSNIGKAVYSSGSSLYTLVIATKRSSLIKHFTAYKTSMQIADEKKRNAVVTKYEKTYENYLNTLERYITETIYTKMQKRASNLEEEKIMAAYYEINALKGIDHVEYKKRLEMLLLNMEWNAISATKSGKFLEKYKEFYLHNMEELYKASMRHAAVILANAKEGDQDKYEKIYKLVEDYIKNILPLLEETKENKQVLDDYKRHVLTLDSFAKKDYNLLRRRLSLLGFARILFVYSLPTVAAEQCYLEIISSARTSLSNYFTEADKFEAYQLLLDAIEEYNDNVLVLKSYWNSVEEEAEHKKFQEKWSELKKLARIDYDDFKKQREVLFIRKDLKEMKKLKLKLDEVRRYYRERMLQLNALRRLPNRCRVKAGKWLARRRQLADGIAKKKEEIKIDEVKKEEIKKEEINMEIRPIQENKNVEENEKIEVAN